MHNFRSLYLKVGNKKFLAIFGIALIIRFSLLFFSMSQGEHSFLLFDSYRYLGLGDHLFEDGYYTEKMTEPVFESIFIPPGAPILFYFLKSIGGFPAIILFHIFCQLLVCFFLMKILELLFKEDASRFYLPCGILYAIDIPTIVMGNLIMTETTFTLFLFISIYYFLRFFRQEISKDLIIASLFLGVSALFRPIIIYFPLFMVIFFMISYRNSLKLLSGHILRAILPFYLVTGIWFYSNYQKFGYVFYSYVGDFNLAYFQAANIYADKYSISLPEARSRLYAETRENLKKLPPNELNQVIFYQTLSKNAREIIYQNPVLFGKNAIKAHINLFFRPIQDYLKITLGSKELFFTRGKNHSWFVLIATYWQIILNAISYLLIPFGWLVLRKSDPMTAYFIGTLLLYFILVCTGPEIEARFRVPLVPLIILLSVLGAYQLIEKFKPKT